MSYTFSQAFWSIATDMIDLYLPLLSIGITFYLIRELVHDSVRGGK